MTGKMYQVGYKKARFHLIRPQYCSSMHSEVSSTFTQQRWLYKCEMGILFNARKVFSLWDMLFILCDIDAVIPRNPLKNPGTAKFKGEYTVLNYPEAKKVAKRNKMALRMSWWHCFIQRWTAHLAGVWRKPASLHFKIKSSSRLHSAIATVTSFWQTLLCNTPQKAVPRSRACLMPGFQRTEPFPSEQHHKAPQLQGAEVCRRNFPPLLI